MKTEITIEAVEQTENNCDKCIHKHPSQCMDFAEIMFALGLHHCGEGYVYQEKPNE